MSRVIALCFLLLAAVVGFIHIDSRPVWAPFSVNEVVVLEVDKADKADNAPVETKTTAKTKAPSQIPIPNPRADWLPDTGAPSVHAASLIA